MTVACEDGCHNRQRVHRFRFKTPLYNLGRPDSSTHWRGLAAKYGARDLAVLSTSLPSRERPALWSYIPRLDHRAPGPWLLELFGDDLAWVAGLPQPAVDGPPARRLHALWRELLAGQRTAEDPEIAALGPTAVASLTDLFYRDEALLGYALATFSGLVISVAALMFLIGLGPMRRAVGDALKLD